MKLYCSRVIVCIMLFLSNRASCISQSPSIVNQNLFASQINDHGLIISSPGSFILRDTFSFTTTSTTVAITINASHVTIDFDRQAICQDNGLSEGIGIYICDGCHDILLRGGTIADFEDNAIYVGKGCSQIMLNQMELVNSDMVVLFDGDVANDIFDCSISDCVVSQGFESGFLFSYCNNITVRDTFFIKNNNMGSYLDNCQNMKFASCYFNNSTSLTHCYGMSVARSENILFDSCMFNSMSGSLKTYGLFMDNVSCVNIVNCSACGNVSDSDDAAGIYLKDSEGIIVSSTQTYKSDTIGGSATGIYLDGCIGCQLIKCASLSNTTTSDYACGIRLENGSKNYIDSTYMTNNVNSADETKGIGIYIDSSEESTVVRQSQSYANSGYGIKNDATSSIIVQSATGGNSTANFSGAFGLSFYKTGTVVPQTIFAVDNIEFNRE